MPKHTLYRATHADLEIRESERIVAGLAVPFGEVAEVTDRGGNPYEEAFERGAFAKTIAERPDVKFLALHDSRNRLPLGVATLLREDHHGLYGEFKVSKTREGDDALESIRDGALNGLSVGFQPVKERRGDGGVVVRTEVKLREVSAVPWAAYAGGRVLAVRADGTRFGISQETARARLRLLELENT